ncbi:MAG: AAA family ATPase [Gammaproteobacteria bacterium]|nr:AAA family ATPase [Gammaproteobacteria bacterium]
MITVIANLKGGSGKSTVTFNLGLWLQMKGQPVVAYDLDPQQTLSDVAEVRREEGYTPPLQVNQPRESLLDDMQYHPEKTQVLVDVGASNMQAMKQALSIANRIIIPVPPSQPDVWATQRFLNIVSELENNKSPEMHVFVNRADTHSAVRESDETEDVLAQLPGVKLLPQRLHQRTIYRRSLSEGMSVFEISKRSKAVDEFNRLAGILYPELAN